MPGRVGTGRGADRRGRGPRFEAMEPRTLLSTLVVTNTADAGSGSLRQAILDANAQAASDVITFNIPGGGVQTIRPSSPLPAITAQATIDGATQPGYAGRPLVALDGTGAGASAIGIQVQAAGCTIRGLAVGNFGNRGIDLEADGASVMGCFVGVDPGGNLAAPNGDDGIFLSKSSNDRIGGPGPRDGNLISGNKAKGVHILFGGTSSNTLIQNNSIGVNFAGTAAIGNGSSGIDIFAASPFNQILTNLISGNQGDGIAYFGSDSSDNLIQGNAIGTDVAGAVAIPNGGRGINLGGPPRTRILGNLISGNRSAGINLGFDTAINEVIQGNKIGTDSAGILPIGNSDGGIAVNFSSSKATIGGTAAGQANIIAFNGSSASGAGIRVDNTSTGIAVSGNSIHDNKGLALDLNSDGVSPNTPGGPHATGANLLQNYPVLGSASASGTTTTVVGTLNAAPGTAYRLEFYASATPDPSGYGQGQVYLGFAVATTDSAGNVSFTASLPVGAVAGSVVSATATDPAGNTSEFAKDVVLSGGGSGGGGGGTGSADLTVTLTGSASPVVLGADLVYTARVVNNGPDAEADVVLTDTLPAGVTFVSAHDNGGNPLFAVGGVVTFDVGPLASGASSAIQILVRGNASGVVVDRASATGNLADPNPADNAASLSTTIRDEADVSVAISAAPTPFNLGGDLTYTVTATNIGPSAALGISVVDNLPAGTLFVSATASQGTPVRLGNTVTTAVGTLASGARATITIIVHPINVGTLVDSATIAETTPDPNPADNQQSVSTLVQVTPLVHFAAAAIAAGEGDGRATITVVRDGSTTSPTTVHYATADGTARAGVHYTATAGDLTFPAGVSTASFAVPLIEDALVEGTVTVNLTLSAPTGGNLGSIARAVLSIADDDLGGVVAFGAAGYRVLDNAGPATITVARTGGIAGGVTIHYATTAGGSGTAGVDYDATAGTLSFAPGQAAATFTVNVRVNPVVGPDRTVRLALDQPGGGGAPGSPSAALLTIARSGRRTAGADFDGDGKADIALYRPGTGQWLVSQSTAGPKLVAFGAPKLDIPVPADYDGDGKTDLAVYRSTTGQWLIQLSGGGSTVVAFGQPDVDIPVPGDYDGDGKADLAVYRPTTGQWLILRSTAGAQAVAFGAPGLDRPVPGDYDGDGRTDIAVYRPTTGQWLVSGSTSGPVATAFGQPGVDVPIPADYDGDGKADLAVYRPSTSQWLILRSTAGAQVVAFGATGLDQPVPADYDGDGKADVAVYRTGTGQWLILQSTAGPRVVAFGGPALDVPAAPPLAYRYQGALRPASVVVAAAPVIADTTPTPPRRPVHPGPRAGLLGLRRPVVVTDHAPAGDRSAPRRKT